MAGERKPDFCIECRKATEYEIRKKACKEMIRDKEYELYLTTAICKECGCEMNLPGLIDKNIRERDAQYRIAEEIISVENIKKLMGIYHIGKVPLALALGFGEKTIGRYLDGQVPSKEYSDIMKKALTRPEYMKGLLARNRGNVGETAFKEAMKAVDELEGLFKVSDKMLVNIAYIFEQMQEVTPLALQKILYYAQGIYMALSGTVLFPEDCYAWQHGPVYEKVYFLFRDFQYNPIDDNRFALLAGRAKDLQDKEKEAVDLVIKSFGKYSGKVLEMITHNEKPWMDARGGYGMNEPSHIVIAKEGMKAYFEEISQEYGIDSVEGLNRYINAMLSRA